MKSFKVYSNEALSDQDVDFTPEEQKYISGAAASGEIHPSEPQIKVGTTDLLTAISSLLRSPDLTAAVDGAICYLENVGCPTPLSKDEMVSAARKGCKYEDEWTHQALFDIFEVNHEARISTTRDFLQSMARKYLRSTRYFYPLLTSFCQIAIQVAHTVSNSGRIHLFLRDGLSFWPPLQAFSTQNGLSVDLQLIYYSRRHQIHRLTPEFYSLDPAGVFLADPKVKSEPTLLVDIGLYGSLLPLIIRRGYFARKYGVLFLGSRNPFITGWLNYMFGTELLQGNSDIDLEDMIKLVDTAESLLKPFRLPAVPSQDSSRPVVEITDALSFVCSVAFMWDLFQYSLSIVEKRTDMSGCCLEAIASAKQAPSSWFLAKPVPRWEHADTFVTNWRHGPMYPMCKLSGFQI